MSMADDVAKVKRAKKFAIAQLLIGFLLFGFGIGEQVLKTFFHRFGIGIVAGILVLITGCLGILGNRRELGTSRNSYAALFQFFSLMSSLVGGTLFGLYNFLILVEHTWEDRIILRKRTHDAKMAILAMIIVLGILECCIGCGASGLISSCCSTTPQSSSGVPVAVRMETGATFVADETVTPEAQDNQPQIVLLPDSREMDDPPPPYEAATLDYQTLQVDMPPAYQEAEHGQWKTYV